MAAGASVIAAPGFDAFKFFAWLEELKPTWYSAVPTMHQLVLTRAARQPEAAKNAHLRFIRSSSAALAPSVMAELEAAFGCPVIEAYGMTDATHQMATIQNTFKSTGKSAGHANRPKELSSALNWAARQMKTR